MLKLKEDTSNNYNDENNFNDNNDYTYDSQSIPQTIEELKVWYIDHNLPHENVTRFYIGKNYYQAKAFGIYKDGDEYIVYKNKADGSRTIRYQGPDESYAVNEIFLKLKERIAEQKALNRERVAGYDYYDYDYTPRNVKNSVRSGPTLVTIWTYVTIIGFVLILIWAISGSREAKRRGYYLYEGHQYYYLDGDWYFYSDYADEWSEVRAPYELRENYEDYFESNAYNSYYGVSDFTYTDYYNDWLDESSYNSDWDNDNDYDYDWDSYDSWDSDYGDWDSDW